MGEFYQNHRLIASSIFAYYVAIISTMSGDCDVIDWGCDCEETFGEVDCHKSNVAIYSESRPLDPSNNTGENGNSLDDTTAESSLCHPQHCGQLSESQCSAREVLWDNTVFGSRLLICCRSVLRDLRSMHRYSSS